MKTYTKEELAEVVAKHRPWSLGDRAGARADLRGANLRGANLRDSNLRGADLSGANLRYSNLRGANLRGAHLRYSNLRGANLRGANLRYADLRYSDLSDSNLRDSNLRGANLRGALGLHRSIVPESGAFEAYKKVSGGVVLRLLIPKDAKRLGGNVGRKCRADKARVLEALGTDEKTFISQHDESFAYVVGKTVRVVNFDSNPWNECAPGIHFFITRKEAEEYSL